MLSTNEDGLRRGLRDIADRRVFCYHREKVPHLSNGRRLAMRFDDPTLSGQLMTLDESLQSYLARGMEGVGLVFFPGCGVVGLDLDKCLSEVGWVGTADQTEALRAFTDQGAFVERSRSGTGLHAVALGDGETFKANGTVELFGDRNFIALTGHGGLKRTDSRRREAA